MSVIAFTPAEILAMRDALVPYAERAGLSRRSAHGYDGDTSALDTLMIAASEANARAYEERYSEASAPWTGAPLDGDDAREVARYAYRARGYLTDHDPLAMLASLSYNGGVDHLSDARRADWSALQDAIMLEYIHDSRAFRHNFVKATPERSGQWILTIDGCGATPTSRAFVRFDRPADLIAQVRDYNDASIDAHSVEFERVMSAMSAARAARIVS